MATIKCGDSSCKYWNGGNKCTAEAVTLDWHSVMTVWEGRREYLSCQTYEKDPKFEELESMVLDIFGSEHHEQE